MNIEIKKATDQDFDGIWEIFQRVVSTGDTYVYPQDTTKEDAYHFWMPPDRETYIAILNDKIVGTYYIKANQLGLGSHIANASYMVHPQHHGRGIGSIMALHSLEVAKKLGFIAMQFNLVVSTNKPAVELWKKVGFKTVGTIPNGFKHSEKGFVDTYIMYKEL